MNPHAPRTHAALRRSLLLALLLVVSSLAFAQDAAYQPGSPLMIWKVSSKTNYAYLMGSVHVGNASFYPLPPAIQKAFAESTVLQVEVDMSKLDGQKVAQLMMSLGTYPPPDGLDQHIKPETAAQLRQFCADKNFPAEAMFQMRPWLVQLMIVQVALPQAGFDPKLGLDQHLLDQAGARRVEEVESAEEQIRLLASMDPRDADLAISHALQHAGKIKEMTNRIASVWLRGDADALDAVMAEQTKDDSPEEIAQMHRLREERNPAMTAHLEKCLASAERCFMVVGTMHVVGKQGIVKELAAHGYRVEQLVNQPAK